MADNILDILIRAKDSASTAIKNTSKSFDKMTVSTKASQASVLSIGGAFKTLQSNFLLVASSIAFFTVPLKGIIGQFASFETALTDMGKVTDQAMGEMKNAIMSISPEVGSSTDLMKGYYQVISAGVTDPVKALDLLTVASKAGKASHTDQSEVIKVLTKVMAGYEGEIENVTEASDLLFRIEKEGQTSFGELVPILGSLAKMSKDLGISSDELGGSLAQITQLAGSTAEAGTQYRAVLTALSKSTEVARIVQEEFGYSGVKVAIQTEGFATLMKRLKEEVGGTAESMNKLLGRQEAVLGASALGANNFENLTAKIASMGDKTGMTDEAFKKWSKTLEAMWDTFKNTLGKMAIQIGQEIAPTLKKLLEDMGTKAPQMIEKFSVVIKAVIVVIKLLVTTIGIIIDNLGLLAIAFGATAFSRAPIIIASITKGYQALAISIKSATLAQKAFLPVLAFMTGMQIGKWFNDVNIAGIKFGDRMQIIVLGLQRLGAQIRLATLEVKLYAQSWNPFFDDKRKKAMEDDIAREERRIEILKHAQDGLRGLNKETEKATEVTKEKTRAVTDDMQKILEASELYEDTMGKANTRYLRWVQNIEEGTKIYLELKKKELITYKANQDLELAKEKQRYDEGLISFEEYVNKKTIAQQTYSAEVIALAEQELKQLKLLPATTDEHFKAIQTLSEKIKQLRLKANQEKIKSQQELTKAIEKELKEELDIFTIIKERELDALQAHHDQIGFIEDQMVIDGALRQSDALTNKLARDKESYDKQIELAKETEEKMSGLHGFSSQEYEDAKNERLLIQSEMESGIIASENEIKNARKTEEDEAFKYIAELTGDKIILAEKEAEEKIKIVKDMYIEGLISARQHAEALKTIEEEKTEAVRKAEETKQQMMQSSVIVSKAMMNETQQILEDSTDRIIGNLYDTITRWGKGLYDNNIMFPELERAIEEVVQNIKNITGELPEYLVDLANDVGMGVTAGLFKFGQEAGKYLQKVRAQVLNLQGFLLSLEDQLMQLQGDEIGLVESWYQQQLLKLAEQFEGLEGTADYKKAKALIEALYREKLKLAKQALKEEEEYRESIENRKEKNKSKGGGGGTSIVPILPIPDTIVKPGDILKVELNTEGFVESLSQGLQTALQPVILSQSNRERFNDPERKVVFNANLELQALDLEGTQRWMKNTLFPELEKYFRLRGMDLTL